MADERAFVLIIGAARSGTKFLRDTLAAHPSVFAVPYDVNFIWRLGNEGNGDDELVPEQCDASTAAAIRRSIIRASGIPVGQGGIVLEKTVSNALRIPYVDRVFPEARYIHLLRDGRDVVESAARMWRAPADPAYLWRKLKVFPLQSYRYALWFAAPRLRAAAGRLLGGGRGARPIWGPRYRGIERDAAAHDVLTVAARQWLASVRSARASFAAMAPERVHQVRYEALVRDEHALKEVCRFLGLADDEPVMRRYRAEVRRDVVAGWRRLDDRQQRELMGMLGPTLELLGYPGAPARMAPAPQRASMI